MPYKDKVIGAVVGRAGLDPKSAQLAATAVIDTVKLKMPAHIATLFQAMMESESGNVIWPPATAVDVKAPVDKPKTFGSRVSENVVLPPPVHVPTSTPGLPKPIIAKAQPQWPGLVQRVTDYWKK